MQIIYACNKLQLGFTVQILYERTMTMVLYRQLHFFTLQKRGKYHGIVFVARFYQQYTRIIQGLLI